MDIQFKADPNLPPDQIELTLAAQRETPAVRQLMDYLARYQSMPPEILPVRSNDQVQLIKVKEIILIDVSNTDLLITTVHREVTTKGRLNALLTKLKQPDFIQISKHAAINLNQLKSLENSFSGNMTAILTNGVKTSVSRKYLGALEQRLGLLR
ncbi:MAG: LytTR family DNA-binding domain-containing protein [Lactobacillus sp.]|nr:LytTR family transcriptional regulator [Lactobacillus sp.]MDN6052167.1 LytTR family transcriptional regulator [Lactobacillus sp.]